MGAIIQDPANSTGRLRAGEFEVDLRSGELWRNGDKIKLQQRPFQILAALLEKPGEVVTREDIQQKIWATETFVDFEHGINTAVKKLREALGDDPDNPTYIQTLPRRGNRFVAPVGVTAANRSRAGGTPVPVCHSCGGAGGKYFYLRFRDAGEMGGGVAVAIPLSDGKQLPELPSNGYNSVEQVKGAVAKIDMSGKTIFAPGPDPSVYAYAKATVQRNLFSIPLE